MEEAPDRRESSRKRLDLPCALAIEGRSVKGTLVNLSSIGALFKVDAGAVVSDDDLGLDASFVLTNTKTSRRYTGEIIRRYVSSGAVHIGLRFWEPSVEVGRP